MHNCLLGFCVLLLVSVSGARAVEMATLPVELRWRGQPVALAEADQKNLTEEALQFVASSQFHSGDVNSLPAYTRPGASAMIQSYYRALVLGGNYVVVNLPEPREVQTMGGEIKVTAIIVGLNHDDLAADLFTINEANGVIMHGKYYPDHLAKMAAIAERCTGGK